MHVLSVANDSVYTLQKNKNKVVKIVVSIAIVPKVKRLFTENTDEHAAVYSGRYNKGVALT